ncbi:MAG: hypothetical protein ACU0CA_15070 [Paracoccaceae bacterium]
MAETDDSERILTEIEPSIMRRAVAIFMAFGVGLVLVYTSLMNPPESVMWRGTMLLVGIGALFLSDLVRRATVYKIVMTHDVIRDTAGRVLCRMEDIKAVERSALAFKPSNGFLIITKTPQSRTWAPGLWWRFGRRIGVGGVTSAAQAKVMANLVMLKLNGDLEKFHPRDLDEPD